MTHHHAWPASRMASSQGMMRSPVSRAARVNHFQKYKVDNTKEEEAGGGGGKHVLVWSVDAAMQKATGDSSRDGNVSSAKVF